MGAQKGNDLPVSVFEPGGVFPMGTTKFEKRTIANQLPRLILDKCSQVLLRARARVPSAVSFIHMGQCHCPGTQCNYCAFICPHAAIRPFVQSTAEEEISQPPDT